MAGWSATDLHWEGVGFETFYRMIIEPSLLSETSITHLVFGGLDGYRVAASIEDVLTDDVLIAEHLEGRPLGGDHGAPVRLVSPNQYGYVSMKHLCHIELHTAAPKEILGAASAIARMGLRGRLVMRHPRARVWQEERHPHLPARLLRPVYRLLIPPITFLSARGSREARNPPQPQ